MSVAPPVQMEAAEALARHLKDHPESATRSHADLAESFDLPEVFVRQVFEALHGRPSQDRRVKLRPSFGRPFAQVIFGTRRLFGRLSDNPERFIAISTIVSVALIILLSLFEVPAGKVSASNDHFVITAVDLWTIVIGVLALGSHWACYFRAARARHALYGGLICWIIIAPVSIIFAWLQIHGSSDVAASSGLWSLLVLTLLILMLCCLYAGLGVAASTLGGYLRVKKEFRSEEGLSRQELLERMFEVQERLKPSNRDRIPDKAEWWREALAKTREHSLVWSFSLGVIGGLFLIPLMLFGQNGNRLASASFPMFLAIVYQLVIICFQFVSMAIAGFTAKNSLLAIRNAVTYVAGSFLPIAIPYSGHLGQTLRQQLSWTNFAANIVFASIVALFGNLGKTIEERAAQQRRLKEDDPAALLAEMVRIQWRLSPSTHSVCVMVVDAAKSSTMKASSDPLVVEWTFREYQRFIEEISARYQGSVYSTAGDGAVVAFPSCAQAFEAARRIQTDVAEFNRSINKLALPFRLRIGLHTGEVVAELRKVEYTEVIDIAAHIEATAPVGGIALTASVAADLEGERLAELKEEVDGFQVFVALNPTVSA